MDNFTYPGFPPFPTEEIPYGYIYRIVDTRNSNTYIGQRAIKYDRDWNTYWGSGKIIRSIKNKYGTDILIKEFISYAYTKEELDNLEETYILEEKKIGYGQYNLLLGPAHRAVMLSEVYIKKGEEARKKNKHKYDLLFSKWGEDIISSYRENKNLRKTSLKFGIPIARIKGFLEEQGVALNYQNVKGGSISESKLEAIKLGIVRSQLTKDGICDDCIKVALSSEEILDNNKFHSSECYNLYLTSSLMVVCVSHAGKLHLKENLKDSCGECYETLVIGESNKMTLPVKTCSHCKSFYNGRQKSKFCSIECRADADSGLTKETLEKARGMYEVEGYPLIRIAEELGLNRKALSKKLKSVGVGIRVTSSKA